VEKAIEHEIERQIDLIEGGGKVVQETRLYDPDRDETRSMRGKEEAHDYRYFPDPDLPPLVLDEGFVDSVRVTLPELPDAKRTRFVDQYGLSATDAGTLTASSDLANYYEAAAAAAGDNRLAANWVMGELAGYLNKENLEIGASKISAEALGGLIQRIRDNTISGKIAKEVFDAMWSGSGDADSIIEQKGLTQISDSGALEQAVDEVIAANPTQVEQYKGGQEKLLGFFVGQVMKATGGKANPKQVNDILRKKLA